ncbi:MAG: hypothetical protein P8Y36_13935, partial [Alphaproteobacteria bacterium]
MTELAFWGVDAEVGWRVPLEYMFGGDLFGAGFKDDTGYAPHHDLRIFFGGYLFDNSAFEDEVVGPRVRTEWQIKDIIPDVTGSRLTLEAAWQHDNVRKHQVEAGVRLRVPLGVITGLMPEHTLTAQEERMTEGLKRDTDIVARNLTATTSSVG